MKVKRGDIITADSVNDMVGVMEKLYDRVQRLEKTVQKASRNRPGRVMEVEGIGREQWERLVKEGIVTLYDLGRRSTKEIMSVLDLSNKDMAKGIVTDAYALAGGTAGHPLTDLQSIGSSKAERLRQSGIKNLGDFSTADPKTIADVLGEGTSVADAEDMKRKAKSLIPRHAES
jgi:predicted flap endonuclease-1-like 5' DNA nuclease